MSATSTKLITAAPIVLYSGYYSAKPMVANKYAHCPPIVRDVQKSSWQSSVPRSEKQYDTILARLGPWDPSDTFGPLTLTVLEYARTTILRGMAVRPSV